MNQPMTRIKLPPIYRLGLHGIQQREQALHQEAAEVQRDKNEFWESVAHYLGVSVAEMGEKWIIDVGTCEVMPKPLAQPEKPDGNGEVCEQRPDDPFGRDQ